MPDLVAALVVECEQRSSILREVRKHGAPFRVVSCLIAPVAGSSAYAWNTPLALLETTAERRLPAATCRPPNSDARNRRFHGASEDVSTGRGALTSLQRRRAPSRATTQAAAARRSGRRPGRP